MKRLFYLLSCYVKLVAQDLWSSLGYIAEATKPRCHYYIWWNPKKQGGSEFVLFLIYLHALHFQKLLVEPSPISIRARPIDIPIIKDFWKLCVCNCTLSDGAMMDTVKFLFNRQWFIFPMCLSFVMQAKNMPYVWHDYIYITNNPIHTASLTFWFTMNLPECLLYLFYWLMWLVSWNSLVLGLSLSSI